MAVAAPVEIEWICPIACRGLWAEVLRAAIADGAYELARARCGGQDVEPVRQGLRSYFASRDGAMVAAFAGLDLHGSDRVAAMMAACERLSHQNPVQGVHIKRKAAANA